MSDDAPATPRADELAPTVRGGAGDRAHDAPARVGRYLIEAEIGAGAMGTVYRARDPELDRVLAIKVIRARRGDSRARLLREAQAMAKVRHPNVVPIFDVGTLDSDTGGDTDAGLFVVMPLVAGGTLRAWMRRGPHPWRDVVARFTAAGRGLAAAHAAGLVHRDFKPDNVLVADDGEILVADFGLALAHDAPPPTDTAPSPTLETSTIAGTPAYMAPEQRAGAPLDARTDQFAFCIAFWEGLFGERPGDARTRTLVRAPLAKRSALHADGDAPAWLRATLERGLSADPAHRWPTIAALLDHVRARLQRPRRLAIAITAAALLATAGIAIALAATRTPTAAPAPTGPTYGAPELIARFRPADGMLIATVSPDGQRMIVEALRRDEMWIEARASGHRTPLRTPPALQPMDVRATDGDTSFAIGNSRAGHGVWRIGPTDLPRLVVEAAATAPFAVTRDGRVLAVATGDLVQRYDGATGAPIGAAARVEGVRALVFADQARLVALRGAGPRGELVNVDGPTVIASFDVGPGETVTSVVWTPASGYVVELEKTHETGQGRASLLAISDDGAAAQEILHRDGEMFSSLTATDRGVFFMSAAYDSQILVGELTATTFGSFSELRTGSRSDGRVAGWIDDQTLLFSTQSGASMGIARQSLGQASTLLIDTPVDDQALAWDSDRAIGFARTPTCAVVRGAAADQAAATIAAFDCATQPWVICADGHAPCIASTTREGRPRLAWLDLATGAQTPMPATVTAPRGRVAMGSISPDGRWLAWAPFTDELQLIDTQTGAARTLFTQPNTTLQCVGWGHDGRYLIATSPSDAGTRVLRVELDGRAQVLATYAGWMCDPRVSPDGRRLAVQAIEYSSSFWILPPATPVGAPAT